MSVVGIDLGTTNTVVACVRAGKVHVLGDSVGARLLPSVVSFHPNGDVLVGSSAKARRIIDPKNTVYSHKRLIGRSWGSPELAQAAGRFAFDLREGPGQAPLIRARGQDYTLPEISAFVLKRVRQIAESATGAVVQRAVITVPAHFNELQRASTKVAGRVSGLEVLRILNEPTAAALAYGLGRTGNERVAVYDLGGGTFDCTLLDLNGNVFEVLATAGDSFLGGDDIDNLIAERMADVYLATYRYDPRTDPQMFERLKMTAEEVKMALSTAETHTAVLHEFGHGAQGSAVTYAFTISRRDLEQMITPLLERSLKVTQEALALARLSPSSFDKVILVGGSTRIPLVRRRVEEFFRVPLLDRVNPDEVVAIGAAIQAAALTEGTRKPGIPAPPPSLSRPRTLTSPGVAPATSPMTARSASDQPHVGPRGGEPKSLEGLTVPKPAKSIEWSPSSEKASVTATDLALNALTARPQSSAGFGTLDETPARPSMPSASTLRGFESETDLRTANLRPANDAPRTVGGTVPGKRPEIRKPSQVNLSPFAGPTMATPAPRPVTPRPFGPMDRSPDPRAPFSSVPPQHEAPPKMRPSTVPSAFTSTPGILPQPLLPRPSSIPPLGLPSAIPLPMSPTLPPARRSLPASFENIPLPSPPTMPPLRMSVPAPYELATTEGAYAAPILVDVTPRGLVVETAGGYADTLLPRNSKIPCERTRRFATGRDLQTTVRVRVGQGEEPVFSRNTYLGEVTLEGLRSSLRGDVVIAVTFEVDADGTLRISARDLRTGQEAHATLQLIGIADESSVVMMINRFAQQPTKSREPL